MEFMAHGLPADARAGTEFLKRTGIGSVICQPDPTVVHLARQAGLRVYLSSGAYHIAPGDTRDLLCVDVNGEPQEWFNSNCPNQPVVRDRHLSAVRRLAQLPGVHGIYIDGARFASPASGLAAFFTCFCPACRAKATAQGFDFTAMRQDVAELYRRLHTPDWLRRPGSALVLLSMLTQLPGVAARLRFRTACTTEHMRSVRDEVKKANPAIQLGMYTFAPILAGFVGQSYAQLAGVVDLISPMLYRMGPVPEGIACLNTELWRLGSDLGQAAGVAADNVISLLLSLSGYMGIISVQSMAELRAGLPPQVIETETVRARKSLGADIPLAPIIWLADESIEQSVAAARQGGATAISFYVYRAGNERYLQRAVQG